MKNFTISHLKKKRRALTDQLKNIESDVLRGSLIKRHRQCGKPNCHCIEEEGHPSYYLSVSMPGIRPIMIYISFKNKAMVEKALSNYQKTQKIMETLSDINRELLARKELL